MAVGAKKTAARAFDATELIEVGTEKPAARAARIAASAAPKAANGSSSASACQSSKTAAPDLSAS